jgi:hypothetical protein
MHDIELIEHIPLVDMFNVKEDTTIYVYTQIVTPFSKYKIEFQISPKF